MNAYSCVVAVMIVRDLDAVLPWYRSLLGDPDLTPMDGVAEWKIAENAWVQVSAETERAGGSNVILQVDDVDVARREVVEKGITAGDVADYGFVRVLDLADPDGNRVSLVQDT